MPTKPVLEKMIVKLKEQVKDLTQQLKENKEGSKADLGDSPYRAIGLYLDGKSYKFARIDYNPETMASKIVSLEDASRVPEAAHMAKYNLEEIISDEIIARLEEDYV